MPHRRNSSKMSTTISPANTVIRAPFVPRRSRLSLADGCFVLLLSALWLELLVQLIAFDMYGPYPQPTTISFVCDHLRCLLSIVTRLFRNISGNLELGMDIGYFQDITTAPEDCPTFAGTAILALCFFLQRWNIGQGVVYVTTPTLGLCCDLIVELSALLDQWTFNAMSPPPLEHSHTSHALEDATTNDSQLSPTLFQASNEIHKGLNNNFVLKPDPSIRNDANGSPTKRGVQQKWDRRSESTAAAKLSIYLPPSPHHAHKRAVNPTDSTVVLARFKPFECTVITNFERDEDTKLPVLSLPCKGKGNTTFKTPGTEALDVNVKKMPVSQVLEDKSTIVQKMATTTSEIAPKSTPSVSSKAIQDGVPVPSTQESVAVGGPISTPTSSLTPAVQSKELEKGKERPTPTQIVPTSKTLFSLPHSTLPSGFSLAPPVNPRILASPPNLPLGFVRVHAVDLKAPAPHGTPSDFSLVPHIAPQTPASPPSFVRACLISPKVPASSPIPQADFSLVPPSAPKVPQSPPILQSDFDLVPSTASGALPSPPGFVSVHPVTPKAPASPLILSSGPSTVTQYLPSPFSMLPASFSAATLAPASKESANILTSSLPANLHIFTPRTRPSWFPDCAVDGDDDCVMVDAFDPSTSVPLKAQFDAGTLGEVCMEIEFTSTDLIAEVEMAVEMATMGHFDEIMEPAPNPTSICSYPEISTADKLLDAQGSDPNVCAMVVQEECESANAERRSEPPASEQPSDMSAVVDVVTGSADTIVGNMAAAPPPFPLKGTPSPPQSMTSENEKANMPDKTALPDVAAESVVEDGAVAASACASVKIPIPPHTGSVNGSGMASGMSVVPDITAESANTMVANVAAAPPASPSEEISTSQFTALEKGKGKAIDMPTIIGVTTGSAEVGVGNVVASPTPPLKEVPPFSQFTTLEKGKGKALDVPAIIDVATGSVEAKVGNVAVASLAPPPGGIPPISRFLGPLMNKGSERASDLPAATDVAMGSMDSNVGNVAVPSPAPPSKEAISMMRLMDFQRTRNKTNAQVRSNLFITKPKRPSRLSQSFVAPPDTSSHMSPSSSTSSSPPVGTTDHGEMGKAQMESEKSEILTPSPSISLPCPNYEAMSRQTPVDPGTSSHQVRFPSTANERSEPKVTQEPDTQMLPSGDDNEQEKANENKASQEDRKILPLRRARRPKLAGVNGQVEGTPVATEVPLGSSC